MVFNAELKDIVADYSNIDYGDNDLVLIEDVKSQTIPSDIVRMGFNVFMLCVEGSLRFEVGGMVVDMRSGQVFVCPSATIVNITAVSDDYRCLVMGISDQLLKSAISPYEEIWNRAIYINKMYMVNVESEDVEKISAVYYAMKGLVENRQLKLYKQIMHSQVQTTLLYFCSLIQDMIGDEDSPSAASRSSELFYKFLNVLRASKVKRHSVDYYATELFVSKKYLSAVCNAVSGKTAHEWIKEYVNEDISNYLLKSSLSIKEIALQTGFPDMSTFGKYVRREWGCTPQEFRSKA